MILTSPERSRAVKVTMAVPEAEVVASRVIEAIVGSSMVKITLTPAISLPLLSYTIVVTSTSFPEARVFFAAVTLIAVGWSVLSAQNRQKC